MSDLKFKILGLIQVLSPVAKVGFWSGAFTQEFIPIMKFVFIAALIYYPISWLCKILWCPISTKIFTILKVVSIFATYGAYLNWDSVVEYSPVIIDSIKHLFNF